MPPTSARGRGPGMADQGSWGDPEIVSEFYTVFLWMFDDLWSSRWTPDSMKNHYKVSSEFVARDEIVVCGFTGLHREPQTFQNIGLP